MGRTQQSGKWATWSNHSLVCWDLWINQTSWARHLELSLSYDIFRLQTSKFDNLACFWFAGNMFAKSIQQVELRSYLRWMCKPWHTKQFQTKLKATIGFFNHTILLQSIEVPNCLTQPSLLPPRLSKFQLFEAAIAANHQSSCGRLWYWSTLAQRVTSAHVDWKPGRTYDWRKPKKKLISLSDIPFYILLDSGTPWDTTSTWARKRQVVSTVSGIFWMHTFCELGSKSERSIDQDIGTETIVVLFGSFLQIRSLLNQHSPTPHGSNPDIAKPFLLNTSSSTSRFFMIPSFNINQKRLKNSAENIVIPWPSAELWACCSVPPPPIWAPSIPARRRRSLRPGQQHFEVNSLGTPNNGCLGGQKAKWVQMVIFE